MGAGILPIVVGVTGHRDLRDEDRPKLARLVEDILADLEKSAPHSPILFLSPLAEGADRVAARAALKRGHMLIAPLPFPPDDYKRDFQSPDSIAEFDDLLGQSSAHFVVPGQAGDTCREAGYVRAGEYLLDHSQLLIAMWDGRPVDRDGGTYDVVQRAVELGQRHMDDEFGSDPYDIRLVQIVTPHDAFPEPEGALTVTHLTTGGSAPFYREVLDHIEAFNRHSAALPDKEAPPSSGLPNVESLYRRSELLSTRAQKSAKWSLRTLFQLGLLVVLALEIFEHFGIDLSLAAYILLFLAAALVHLREKRSSNHEHYLDWRAITEAARVQIHWREAGLPDMVADHYPRKHRRTMLWIRRAVRTAGIIAPTCAEPDFPRLRKDWVQGQIDYFIRAGHRDERKLKHFEIWSERLFAASIPLALSIGILRWIGRERAGGLYELLEPLIVTAGAVPALAATLSGFAEKSAWGEHAKEYGRMLELFRAALSRLSKLEDGPSEPIQALFRELGAEALAENADWYAVHRARPPDLIKG